MHIVSWHNRNMVTLLIAFKQYSLFIKQLTQIASTDCLTTQFYYCIISILSRKYLLHFIITNMDREILY